MSSMAMTSYKNDTATFDISYGIYTVERLPRGLKRSPKWDLHSTAKDKKTAEDYAKILSAQPYFDIIEVQEFRTCPQSHKRTAHRVKRYKRQSNRLIWVGVTLFFLAITLITFL